jgi:formylglycine-generating enzyme required for sulfatase activity
MARIPVTRIRHEDALNFCGWLTQKAVSLLKEGQPIYYRLPTETESQNHPTREHSQMNCQTMEGQGNNLGIRLMKTPIPCLFAFETVTVNSRGEILSRQRLTREFIRETISSPLHSESVFLDMVPIPGGTFWMGTEDAEVERLCRKFNVDYFKREQPRHEVTISPFSMGKYPITQAQWRVIASRTDLKVSTDLNPDPVRFKGDNRPVESIDWYSAVEFCVRLSRLTGEQYRLPTEAEWEYACRAGTTTPFYFGETLTGELANYDATNLYADEPKGQYRGETTPVGQFPPNAFGLYDMHGQVWEWCADDWHNNYQGTSIEGENLRRNPALVRSSLWRELRNWFSTLSNRRFRGLKNGDDNRSQSGSVSARGGSWYNNPDDCRSADRDYFPRDYVNADDIGVRVVRVSGRTL